MLNVFGLVVGTEKGFMAAQKKEREQGIKDERQATNRQVGNILAENARLKRQLYAQHMN